VAACNGKPTPYRRPQYRTDAQGQRGVLAARNQAMVIAATHGERPAAIARTVGLSRTRVAQILAHSARWYAHPTRKRVAMLALAETCRLLLREEGGGKR
jgi:hypothetical protein